MISDTKKSTSYNNPSDPPENQTEQEELSSPNIVNNFSAYSPNSKYSPYKNVPKKEHVIQTNKWLIAMLVIALLMLMFTIYLGISRSNNNPYKNYVDDPIIKDIYLPYSMEYLRDTIRVQKLSNGITLFVIYDETSVESAAAIGLNTGTYQERLQGDLSPGITQQLEHSFFIKPAATKEDLKNFNLMEVLTDFEQTQFTMMANKDSFLNAFNDLWCILSDFTTDEKIQDEIASVDSEFQNSLQNPEKVQNYIMQMLSPSSNPYSRLSFGTLSSLKHKNIESEVNRYYNEFYSTKGMIIGAVINSDNASLKSSDSTKNKSINNSNPIKTGKTDSKKINDSKKEMIRMTEEMIQVLYKRRNSLKDTEIPNLNYDIPYGTKPDSLPGLLFLQDKRIPRITMRFQVFNSVTDLIVMENNLHTVLYYLEHLIREKLLVELHFVVSVTLNYTTMFKASLVDINLVLSENGRSKLGNIFRIVYAAIEKVKAEYINKDIYFEEVQKLFNTNFYIRNNRLSSFTLMEMAMKNCLKYGIKYALSGSEMVENYNSVIQDNIISYLTLDNMAAIISENIDISATLVHNKSNNYRYYDLDDVFTQTMGKTSGDYNPFEDSENSIVELDQYEPLTKTFYHVQKIDEKIKQKIIDGAQDENFKDYEMNPYVLSDAFLEQSRTKGIRKFDNDPIKILSGDFTNFYYKFNDNFEMNYIYATVTFNFESTAFIGMNANDLVNSDMPNFLEKLTVTMKVIKSLWNHKIRDIIYKTRWSDSRVMINAHGDDSIILQVYAPYEIFDKTFDEILTKLSQPFKSYHSSEIFESVKELYKEETGNQNVLPIYRATFYLQKILSNDQHENSIDLDYQKNHLNIQDYEFKLPSFTKVYLTGDIQDDYQNKLFDKITKYFEHGKNQTDDLIEENTLNKEVLEIYRVTNTNQSDTQEVYIQVIELGKVTPELQIFAGVLTVLMQSSLNNYLKSDNHFYYICTVESEVIGDTIGIIIKIVAPSAIAAEKPMETFLETMETKFEELTDDEVAPHIQNIKVLYESPKNNLYEDAKSDLRFIQKKLEGGVNEYDQSVAQATDDFNADHLSKLWKVYVKKGARLIVEYLKKVDTNTELDKYSVYDHRKIEVIEYISK